MNLDFNMPVKLITGRGCIRENPMAFAALGSKAMLVTGQSSAKRSGALDDVVYALGKAGIPYLIFDEVQQNPLLSICKKAGAIAAENGVDFIIGIGGGSPLDSAKAIAVYAANPDLREADIYSNTWQNNALSFALVGTTAGTGSELTRFSVVTDASGFKRSFGNQQTYPVLAFGDPSYTDSLSLSFTLSTTLDAMSHALEAYFSSAANHSSDLYALEAVRTLVGVYRDLAIMPDESLPSKEQRDTLYYGSLLAGFALNHCGTCYCHTISYFLSEQFGIPHGFACASTLPDFLSRAQNAYTNKAKQLYTYAKTTYAELTVLINALLRCELPVLTGEQARKIAARYTNDMPNFVKSPGKFTAQDAYDLICKRFVAKS